MAKMIKATIFRYACSADSYKEDIKSLLLESDTEFIPPLSRRISTIQMNNLDGSSKLIGGIYGYYTTVLKQHFILAEKNRRIIGFLSFRHRYISEYLKDFNPSNYVSTVIVRKRYRREGIASELYKILLHDLPANLNLPYITTRTWSTNIQHNTLLLRLGFKQTNLIRNHRGEGIHSLYYAITTTI